MLERLSIRDLALVDRADLVFTSGLNVVTGETGAGKSLLVQSISLLVGERADSDTVRHGAKAATVEGVFRLEGVRAERVGLLLAEWGQALDADVLIVRREVQSSGRSRAWVNQSAVTLAALRRLGHLMADLHGQHEHQSLLHPEAGMETLDRLAGLESDRERFAEALARWREAASAHAALRESLARHDERRDFLHDAARELAEANLVEGEEESLRAEASRLQHTDRLRELVTAALGRLSEADDAAVSRLQAAARDVDQAAALDPRLAELLPTLEEARIAASETGRTLEAYAADLEADPAALERVELRRELIARLARKYRRTLPELIAWRAEIGRELDEGEDREGALARAETSEREAREACLELGRALGRKRRKAAGEWTARLIRELKPLGFPQARLEFEVETPESRVREPGADGLDEVQLRFSANPGELPRALRRIASGGELSRIMLALKTALETQDPVDLLLFDEVDSGIGGAVAQAVGERLRGLARHRQLVCVTHLPMIAALATHHLRVTKRAAGGRTVARFEAVTGDARVDEISRMLAGGRVTDTTRRQAKELLEGPAAKVGTR